MPEIPQEHDPKSGFNPDYSSLGEESGRGSYGEMPLGWSVYRETYAGACDVIKPEQAEEMANELRSSRILIVGLWLGL
jgi:hypothetical protein